MEKCKNCGADLQPGVKFCGKYGAPVDGSIENNSTTASRLNKANNSETIASIKSHSLNYFSWYKKSISKPSEVDNSNKYFGVVSIVISVLLASFAFYSIIGKVFAGAESAINEVSRYYPNLSNAGVPTGFKLYFQLFLMVLVYYAVFILIGFVCKKYMIDKDTTIFNYTNQLGSYGNSIMIVQLLLVLFLLVSSTSSFILLIVFMMILSSISAVAYIGSIVVTKAQAKLDKIYVAIITLFASNAVVSIIFMITARSMILRYVEIIKNLL